MSCHVTSIVEIYNKVLHIHFLYVSVRMHVLFLNMRKQLAQDSGLSKKAIGFLTTFVELGNLTKSVTLIPLKKIFFSKIDNLALKQNKNFCVELYYIKRRQVQSPLAKEHSETLAAMTSVSQPCSDPCGTFSLYETVQKLALMRGFFSLNIFKTKPCWYIVFLCIIFSPFYVFIKGKNLKKITGVFSFLTFHFKLLPPFEHNPYQEIKIKVLEVHVQGKSCQRRRQ